MDSTIPGPVCEALDHERTNWAHGSVKDNPFYTCPSEKADVRPGTLIKLDANVDPSKYFLPPTIAISLFVYQSLTLSDRRVPVSGFILWPYHPRKTSRTFEDGAEGGYPVVAWAHGTSGWDANAAPSNHKNLWQHFLAPYQLALHGYVVVATDFAGLGVKKFASGEDIAHEWLASPSQAKDIKFSVQAARSAFPELSEQFVVVGHSLGGGAAWAVAQEAAIEPIAGYLGSAAISPYTNVLNEKSQFTDLIAACILYGMRSAFPDFQLNEVLNEEGERLLNLVHEEDMGTSSAVTLMSGKEVLKSNWTQNATVKRYMEITSNGNKPVLKPLFIAHGKIDPVLDESVLNETVRQTAARNPSSPIVHYRLANVTHVSALAASQHLWMDWIADRSAGKEQERGCWQHNLDSVRPAIVHLRDQNWFLQPATESFHSPGP